MEEDFVIRVKNYQDKYEVIKDIGQGTYGTVQKCKNKFTNEIVAIKKVKIQREQKIGFPQTTLREVKLLRELKHPNIIKLIEVVQSEDSDEDLFLIFEYCEYDLYSLLYKKSLDVDHIKSIMKQFLIVLQYCANQRVIHRDLKPQNMFITKRTVLKLGDFGLARKIKDEKTRYSTTVITLWYKPPEILSLNDNNKNQIQNKSYKTEIDIWSAGCILYEMVTGEQLFKAKNNTDMSQLFEICSICGPLPSSVNPDFEQFFNSPKKDKFPRESQLESHLKSKLADYPEFTPLIPLLLKMVNIIPSERITAEAALNHPFFREIDSKYEPCNIPEIAIEEIHQRDVSESKKARTFSQDRLDELRLEKVLPKSIEQ